MAGPSTNKLVASMGFDTTKVAQQLSMCSRTKLGLGRAHADFLQECKDENEMKIPMTPLGTVCYAAGSFFPT